MLLSDQNDRDGAVRALDKERAESTGRLPEAAKGAEINVRDAKERRDEEPEEGTRRLAERRVEAARAREEDLPAEVTALANEPWVRVPQGI